ncbi:sulfotransferase family 2 domain-containing protein [Vibrio mediterranei]|uniref:sulfotransferase family 2 domain-containing protein n=1 Tax=Vibrio mediterranei TaxID=689 RepID=UPI00148D8B98|nr:sulfotransferase family 2 domain-containing protein [Vibrio mediterranei]NOH29032.1 sulfotransferase family protein [Vibrio mediterranei]
MLYSKSKKFLFIHVPKTGGTSLVKAMKKDCDRAFLPLRMIGYYFDDRGIKLPRSTYNILGYPYHVKADILSDMWKEHYDELYKFAFVRNPWDIAVSEYFYIKRKKVHPIHKVVNQMPDFEYYLKWKVENYNRDQSEWVCDENDNLLVDFLGRFENYENDARKILKKFGYKSEVPKENVTKKKGYQSYYTDKMAEIVSEMNKRDITNFGYEFE